MTSRVERESENSRHDVFGHWGANFAVRNKKINAAATEARTKILPVAKQPFFL